MANIKDFLWNWLFKGDEKYDLAKDLQVSEDLVTHFQSLFSEGSNDYADLLKKYNEQNLEIIDLNKKIEAIDIEPIKPDFLSGITPYLPVVQINTTNGVKEITLSPTHIYSSNALTKKVALNLGLRDLYISDKKACARAIWKYVIDNIDYELDEGEDWRFSAITDTYGEGDCEDTTILFIDLAHEAGFKANEVFNATGYFTQKDGTRFGHSFPILNCGDGWYVYETTIDSLPGAPMLFLGSNYTANWGLCNWKYGGYIKTGNQI